MIPPNGRPLSSSEQLDLSSEMERIVASSYLFKSLDDEGRKRVIESGYVCSFPAEQTILRQDDQGVTMYLVLRGTVRVETETAGGTVSLADLGRGACFGEVSVLSGTPRTATVTALTDTDCVAFEKHRIERILASYPKVREMLVSLVEGRARDTIEKIVRS